VRDAVAAVAEALRKEISIPDAPSTLGVNAG
jgi:hypothetical protein